MIFDVLQLCKERAATIDKQHAVALEEMRSIKSIIQNILCKMTNNLDLYQGYFE